MSVIELYEILVFTMVNFCSTYVSVPHLSYPQYVGHLIPPLRS